MSVEQSKLQFKVPREVVNMGVEKIKEYINNSSKCIDKGLQVKSLDYLKSSKDLVYDVVIVGVTLQDKTNSKYKPKVYFAAPLFSEQDRLYNKHVYDLLLEEMEERGLEADIYLPQNNEDINDKNSYASAVDILKADFDKLSESDIFVALLDGEDSGVAFEAGVAYTLGMPMIGMWTDVRQQGGDNEDKIKALTKIGENQFAYINLMLSGAFLEDDSSRLPDWTPFNNKLVNNTIALVHYVLEAIEEVKEHKKLS